MRALTPMSPETTTSIAPIFPYLSAGPWQVGPFTIHMFGVMAFLSVIIGSTIIARRAAYAGPDPDRVSNLMVWALLSAFIGSHLFYLVFYYNWSQADWRVMLNPWNGMSSFGGFIGFFAGAWAYSRKEKLSFLRCTDTLMWGAAHAWVVARVGCAFAHDHPGRFTDSWFSVAWPLAHPDQILNPERLPGRHDLGLYEVFFQLVVVALLWLFNRRGERFAGFNVALVFCVYGTGRFFMEWLRTADPRYLGLTTAQYTSVLMITLGVLLVVRGRGAGYATPDSKRAT